MPGRARNVDRQAIEAFARIHRGKAGSANGSRLFNGHRPETQNHANGVGGDHDLTDSTAGPDVAAAAPAGVHEAPPGAGLPPGDPLDLTSFGYLAPLPNLERPRIGRRVAVASTATVVVILIALGVAGAATGPRRSHHTTTPTSAPGPRAAASGSHNRARPAGAGRSTRPSTTTTAGTGPISPTATSAGSVRFLMPGSGPFSVTIAAAGGACWTEVSPLSGSSVSWAGTVADGSQHVLDPGPRWWLRLGAPEYATVTVNGRRLQLPATSAPLDVEIATS